MQKDDRENFPLWILTSIDNRMGGILRNADLFGREDVCYIHDRVQVCLPTLLLDYCFLHTPNSSLGLGVYGCRLREAKIANATTTNNPR